MARCWDQYCGSARGAGQQPNRFDSFSQPCGPLTMARRFATLSLPLEEMHEVGRHFGATLNDVAVTVVDAGLHAYLRETGRAFAHPFISMCPVSLRADGDTTIGTRVSAMFVRLGEPSATAPERIRQVVDSIETAKKELGGMSRTRR